MGVPKRPLWCELQVGCPRDWQKARFAKYMTLHTRPPFLAHSSRFFPYDRVDEWMTDLAKPQPAGPHYTYEL